MRSYVKKCFGSYDFFAGFLTKMPSCCIITSKITRTRRVIRTIKLNKNHKNPVISYEPGGL